eukprot:m.14676 g.14676  ORF g.14676 m.14676 type:complete len:297 (-) comp6394_c0_seq1:319-1209(-)
MEENRVAVPKSAAVGAAPLFFVDITPSTIVFKASPGQKIVGQMKIQNLVNSPVAYKIKTTRPKSYIVKPIHGLLGPREEVPIEITLTNTEDLPDDASKHKFQVHVTDSPRVIQAVQKSHAVPKGEESKEDSKQAAEELAQQWRQLTAANSQQLKLKCAWIDIPLKTGPWSSAKNVKRTSSRATSGSALKREQPRVEAIPAAAAPAQVQKSPSQTAPKPASVTAAKPSTSATPSATKPTPSTSTTVKTVAPTPVATTAQAKPATALAPAPAVQAGGANVILILIAFILGIIFGAIVI